jgi:hypothetical protein
LYALRLAIFHFGAQKNAQRRHMRRIASDG